MKGIKQVSEYFLKLEISIALAYVPVLVGAVISDWEIE
jgi:hypothetical protein